MEGNTTRAFLEKITYKAVPRQLKKKNKFPAISLPMSLEEVLFEDRATMVAHPAKAMIIPINLITLKSSHPMNIHMAAVMIGCEGCHIEAATAFESFIPIMKQD